MKGKSVDLSLFASSVVQSTGLSKSHGQVQGWCVKVQKKAPIQDCMTNLGPYSINLAEISISEKVHYTK